MDRKIEVVFFDLKDEENVELVSELSDTGTVLVITAITAVLPLVVE
jgi:hypothetical protein